MILDKQMIEQGIALHGPQGPTGMGYGIEDLGTAIGKLGRPVRVSHINDGWADPYYHIIIEQPAFIPNCPWNAIVPTFELSLRRDEKKNLLLPSSRHRMFCLNKFIQKEVSALNLDLPSYCFPLIQQGANQKLFIEVVRKPKTIGILGKYEPRKGHDIFFQAIQEIGSYNVFAMITSPLHTSEEINRIQSLCDSNKIQLLPWEEDRDNVLAFLSSLHVAVFPSCAEGWNLGISESIAQGCIVIASDIDAHRRQYEILEAVLGTEEASYRLRLIPTKPVPIKGHDRWYPGAYYVGKKWLECDPRDLKEAILQALRDNPLPMPDAKNFPLSWEAAAKVFITEVDKAVNKTSEKNSI